jgi:hypothetical protein
LLYVFFLILFRLLTHRRYVIISSTIPKNAAEIGFARILEFTFGSRYFQYPSIQAPVNETFGNRKSESGMVVRDKIREKAFTRERYQNWIPSNRICFLSSEIDLIERHQAWTESNPATKSYLPIGLPRLFPGWKMDLENVGVPIIEKELRRLGLPEDSADLIVVVLTIPDQKFWFDYVGQFHHLLDDLVSSLRKRYPDNPIILKEKPVGIPLFDDLKERYDDDRIFLSSCALSVLGIRAEMAFSIQESSGLCDLAIMGIPAIEYGHYNDEWLAQWPQASANAGEPGIEVALSRERLDELIAMVADGSFPTASHQQFSEQLGHIDNLDALIGVRR